MAIIVDKEEKRRNIALSCQEILYEKGIENLTVSQIAKTAGVGKGTIYEYFENKEDIVFEIISTVVQGNLQQLEALVQAPLTTREKLFLFGYAIFDGEAGEKHLKIFKEFLGISLTRHSPAMLAFSEQTEAQFQSLLARIIREGIDRGEIEERFAHAAGSLIIFSNGLVIDSCRKNFDVKQELNAFLDLLFPIPTGEHT